MGESQLSRGVCPGCGEAVDDGRCAQCGVARAPGGYIVEKVIATTPHSRLYRARDPQGRIVAVKELLFALVPGVKEIEAFEREASLLRTLDHPRIPRFFASFQEGKGVGTRLYLVQDFVEGESLADRLSTHRFDESEARDIARQVLEILTFLHGLTPTILHRDVKPANLIRRPDGTLVLVDFGAARDLEGQVTHRATVVGTYGYMPPEQHGGTVDATADVYALGATLIHLLSRKAPADLAQPGEGLEFAAHVKAAPPFIEWLTRLVAFKREARFPTARKALNALNSLDLSAALPTPRDAPGVSPKAFVGVVALAVVAIVALALALAPKAPQPAPSPLAPPVEAPASAAIYASAPPIPSTGVTEFREEVEPPVHVRPRTSVPPPVVSNLQRVKPIGESMRGFFLSKPFRLEGPFHLDAGRAHGVDITEVRVGEPGSDGVDVTVRYTLSGSVESEPAVRLTVSAGPGVPENALKSNDPPKTWSFHPAPENAVRTTSLRVDPTCVRFQLRFDGDVGPLAAEVDLEARTVRQAP